MLVTFRSEATESITMFGDVAQTLLKMMGATGRVPGALVADDVPAALARLEQEVQALKAVPASPAPQTDRDEETEEEDEKDKDKERAVPLATRAVPLIDLLRRAVAAKAGVMWEAR
ncbi:MAG TPA: DUF1840 domain-containing protein [Steroidobacteraceae bacterium]